MRFSTLWQFLQHWHQINQRYYLYPIYLVLLFLSTLVLQHNARQYSIRGIDVSHYQGHVDWQLLKEQESIHFAFIKATEGRNYKDSYFEKNWKQTKQVGIIRGAYHFYRAHTSAYWQAQQFIKTVRLRKGDLPPVLDIEEVEQVDKETLVKNVRKWLEEVEAHYAIRPIIYASLDLYQRHLKAAFPDYIVWIARYNHRQPPRNLSWSFWQYTDKKKMKGIVGNVDGNVFSGTYTQLKALCL